MNKPYLCISALQSLADIEGAVEAFDRWLPSANGATHSPCFGFAVDAHTIAAEVKWSPRKVESVTVLKAGIVRAGARGFKAALHLDLQDRSRGSVGGSSLSQLEAFFLPIHSTLPALLSMLDSPDLIVQINAVVPPHECEKLKNQFENISLVFPLSQALLSLPENQAAQYVHGLAGVADTFLLDRSGGAGLEFLIEDVRSVAELLRANAPQSKLAISGGLNPKNIAQRVQQLASDETLMKIFPLAEISFDVESGVRSSVASKNGGKLGADTDRIDSVLVSDFVKNAYAALGSS